MIEGDWDMTGTERIAHLAAETARLRRTLPLRVRLRMWKNTRVNGVAFWLVDHRRFRAAEALWRASGAWRRRSA